MRSLLAIMLLGIFLFQLVGYYFVYIGLKLQSDKELNARLDSHDYAADETITIKIPFTLPYWMTADQFERVDGDFEYQGQFYKMIKQRLEGDTLYVVCIKNVSQKLLSDALGDYIKLTNDLPTTSKNALKLWGRIVKDYISSPVTELITTEGWSASSPMTRGQHFGLISNEIPVITPPPEVA